jgi:glyoxylase-like metal-dependent hydrolase (beta-lactamase superfamily II)
MIQVEKALAMSAGTGAAAEPGCIPLDRSFEGRPGELIRLSPLVRRMVAPNAGAMTFMGTCTYVVGSGKAAIIDPGPESPDHAAALLAALQGETVIAILVTHSHKDHAAGARALKAATGAKIFGCTSYQPSGQGRGILADAVHDLDHAPDAIMREGDSIETKDFSLVCVETPGHTKNHQAFALPEESALFTGDHVMAWSTSVVAPPDGTMRHYMASLEKLLARGDKTYWPGHGGPVRHPQSFVRALIRHRRMREEAILACIKAGNSSIAAIAAKVYGGLDSALEGAALLSVLAHAEDLMERGLIKAGEIVAPGNADRNASSSSTGAAAQG